MSSCFNFAILRQFENMLRFTVFVKFLYVVQTGSGVHPTSYPMGTGGSFLGGKAAGTYS
jgi:hypothetical protein